LFFDSARNRFVYRGKNFFKEKRPERNYVKDGIIIGLAQTLALIPGSSRSGVTITAGLFCGLKEKLRQDILSC